jgi:hypothetical protein
MLRDKSKSQIKDFYGSIVNLCSGALRKQEEMEKEDGSNRKEIDQFERIATEIRRQHDLVTKTDESLETQQLRESQWLSLNGPSSDACNRSARIR